MTSADPARADLDRRILAWMSEADWTEDEARFESLALELFAHQFARCEPYARFCRARGRTPETVSGWQEIPAVPTGAFKEMALRSFPAERECHVFRTSGTATQRRGELHLDTLRLYEASLVPSFERHLLPEWTGSARRVRSVILAPSRDEAPDSSLSHMFDVVLQRRGDARSGFFVRNGELQVKALLQNLEQAMASDVGVLLGGTAFAFVHLLERLERSGSRIALPAGSRIIETGGFKGRSRELPREELYRRLRDALGVPHERIVNQYGMTELGSQFYDSVLRFPATPRRKLRPPWTRVRIVDPESGEESTYGETGMLTVFDLANTGSVLAVATADLGRAFADGFEVIGRQSGAEARGCSIALDEMLSAPGRTTEGVDRGGPLP